jgi:hypothetical protein
VAVAAGLEAFFVAGALHQDPPHRLGRCGKEMAATVPLLRLGTVHEAQIRLMDQGCGLESLAGAFARHFLRRQAPQLIVHQRQQLLGCPWITQVDCRENLGNAAHNFYLANRLGLASV